ncbi:MAG: hypothetical protein AAGD07_12050 [Planctomycetota bacterium]
MTERFWQTVRPFVSFLAIGSQSSHAAAVAGWQEGDWAVYRKSKRSKNPGRRAAGIKATSKGETYAYVVDKFWVVTRVLPNGDLLLKTAGGKKHQISPSDPNLLRPGWLTRLRWRDRFRAAAGDSDAKTTSRESAIA